MTSHEISLVRIEPGHTPRQVLSLILAGATKPPPWASIVELLSVLDHGKTVYVRFDLRPGSIRRGLPLERARFGDPLHAQLGMIGAFDVT